MDFKHVASTWWADRLQMSDYRAHFQAALHKKIKKNMTISTDYDPDGTLLEALQEAHITCRGFMFSCRGILPEKTFMRIDGKIISVSEGYGAPFKTIS